jgi:D-alanyl-D-alanine carboxypeptidase
MPVRGKVLRPRIRFALRAPLTATLLSLLMVLAPDHTFAPTLGAAPNAAAGGPVPVAGIPLSANITPPRLARTQADAPPAPPPVATAPIDTAAFQAALGAAREHGQAFGVTFAAVRDGEVIWAGSSGVTRDGETLAPDAEMVIGSVTKTFVAATVLQLAEEGRINLDASVRGYLPEQRRVDRAISVRQLLNHTSGLADVFNDRTKAAMESDPGRAWTSKEVLAAVGSPWFEPGRAYGYANTNYHLLGLIVERVTGATLESQIEARFLGPLGLHGTRSLDADNAGAMLPKSWASIFWASGAMSSNATDLARWGDALLGGEVLDDATLEAMTDVHSDDYGLGIKRLELPRRVGYGHTGLLYAYTTMLIHLPKDDVTVALLVNRTQVDLPGMLAKRSPGKGPSLLRLVIDS